MTENNQNVQDSGGSERDPAMLHTPVLRDLLLLMRPL
jgi:16S rRNA (cytosine1402-N4)-methyltransferase